MTFTTPDRRLDRAECLTTLLAVTASTALYFRYGHPYLARGVIGDLAGLGLLGIPLLSRQRRGRHKAAVCLAAIGAVQAIHPRWPLTVPDPVWWAAIGSALAAYLVLRHRWLP